MDKELCDAWSVEATAFNLIKIQKGSSTCLSWAFVFQKRPIFNVKLESFGKFMFESAQSFYVSLLHATKGPARNISTQHLVTLHTFGHPVATW